MPVNEPQDLGLLFHRLNNQLGIILANAELLEAKLGDEMGRARASQVVASVLDAMATAREIRLQTPSGHEQFCKIHSQVTDTRRSQNSQNFDNFALPPDARASRASRSPSHNKRSPAQQFTQTR